MLRRYIFAFFTLLICIGNCKKQPCGEDFRDVREDKHARYECRKCKGKGAKLVWHPEWVEGIGYSKCQAPGEDGWEEWRKQKEHGNKVNRLDMPMDGDDKEPTSGHELTHKNWEERTSGQKHVFVKFFAPWCHHCASMKPLWERLVTDFGQGVYEVDCVNAGMRLCTELGIRSYPTLKFGDPKARSDLQVYDGAREYDAMKTFMQKLKGHDEL